jgi:hypothetical protein
VSQFVAAGAVVTYIIVTNGDKGCAALFCRQFSPAQLAVQREAEQRNASVVLGVPVNQVVMLKYPDAYDLLGVPHELVVADLVAAIRHVGSDVLFSFFPDTLYNAPHLFSFMYHPDNVLTGKLAQKVNFGVGVERLWTNLGAPVQGTQLFMFCSGVSESIRSPFSLVRVFVSQYLRRCAIWRLLSLCRHHKSTVAKNEGLSCARLSSLQCDSNDERHLDTCDSNRKDAAWRCTDELRRSFLQLLCLMNKSTVSGHCCANCTESDDDGPHITSLVLGSSNAG